MYDVTQKCKTLANKVKGFGKQTTTAILFKFKVNCKGLYLATPWLCGVLHCRPLALATTMPSSVLH
jgi:hypothetical protein